jgi:hypothetical protein
MYRACVFPITFVVRPPAHNQPPLLTPNPMPASLTFTTGDLLTADVDGLVNAVNCEGVMGKGIAVQFKQAWPTMFVEYQRLARAGGIGRAGL